MKNEHAMHEQVIKDIREECREPFIVPALLDAFLGVKDMADSLTKK
jgi:hypothetical protein